MNKIELKDFLNYIHLSNLQSNPSQDKFAFIKTKLREEENDYFHDLYVTEDQDNSYKRLISLGSSGSFYWETDTTLLFPYQESKQDEKDVKASKSVFYRLNIENGELCPAYTFPIPVQNLKVLNDTTLLLSSRLNPADYKMLTDERDEYVSSFEKDSFFEIIDTVPFYNNGGGFSKGKINQLFLYDITSQSLSLVGDKNHSNSLLYLDEENTTIYFSESIKEDVPYFYTNILSYNYKTKETTSLYNKNDFSFSMLTVLNDKVYVSGSNLKDYGINQNGDFYELKDNSLTLITNFGLSNHNSVGSDVRYGGSASAHTYNNIYYFVGTYRDRTVLYSFDGETINTIFSDLGSIDGCIQYKGEWIAIGLFNQNLQELYKLNLKDNKVEQLSKFNISLEGKYNPIPQHIEFTNDGQLLDGWVLLPENYNKDKKYPAILDIHGGPKTIYSDVFYHEMKAWANMGYIVFYCNPRGGDVYDNEFMDIRGKYGTIDYEDIMKFTDIVLDTFSIDPERVGVTGGSYGGFMTNWIVGHTNRFKAAATQRSISNWISFYGTSDIGTYFAQDQVASNPFDSLDKMWEQSPLKYAKNIETPLLLIHSDEDYRCPVEQAMQIFTVVKNNGVDTRMLWVHGENHDLSRSGKPKARVKRLEEITNWFENYLK